MNLISHPGGRASSKALISCPCTHKSYRGFYSIHVALVEGRDKSLHMVPSFRGHYHSSSQTTAVMANVLCQSIMTTYEINLIEIKIEKGNLNSVGILLKYISIYGIKTFFRACYEVVWA